MTRMLIPADAGTLADQLSDFLGSGEVYHTDPEGWVDPTGHRLTADEYTNLRSDLAEALVYDPRREFDTTDPAAWQLTDERGVSRHRYWVEGAVFLPRRGFLPSDALPDRSPHA